MTGGLICVITVLIIGIFISYISVDANNSTTPQKNVSFNAKTPQEKAIFVSKLNYGINYYITVFNASLTPDGKYWIVKMREAGYDDWVVTVDAKTLMSKEKNGVWKSFDELKAVYIAEIQSTKSNGGIGKPTKVTMEGKEIWKVPVYYYHEYDPKRTEYVYVDVTTGKSKNELYSDVFNEVSGANGWLTLKEVDDIINKINKMDNPESTSFKDALRELYPE